MQQFVCFVVQQLMKESNAVLTLLSYDVCHIFVTSRFFLFQSYEATSAKTSGSILL